MQFQFDAACQPSATFNGAFTSDPATRVIVGPDGRFFATATSQGTTNGGGQLRGNGSITGSFDAIGNASGTLQIHLAIDDGGTHYECDTGLLTWTAA